jgi:hypothetical protein
MESNDKDFRYMAANDLISTLSAGQLAMDERLEHKVRCNRHLSAPQLPPYPWPLSLFGRFAFLTACLGPLRSLALERFGLLSFGCLPWL